jgi:hypothetical protein
LVTDLPADFAVFGQAVATSMADLLGGTTGQVLSKASNTDMDFTWVAQDDSNAIQNAIVDAKGDLIAASAADTPARLAVGNNGETLVADSSTSTGLRYQTPKVQNGIYNSAFNVWQRGTTSAATANIYTADRWQKGAGNNFVVSRQATGDTTNLPNIQYCARVQRNAGNTAGSVNDFGQTLETIDAIKYAGKTVTMSFYARAGANYSPTSGAFAAHIYTGTGTDQSIMSGLTGSAIAMTVNATLTTTWQRFQATATITSAATELAFYCYSTPTGTAGANDYYEITGVQIEYGSIATPYMPMNATIQGELAACQRYYYRIASTTQYNVIGVGQGKSTTVAGLVVPFPTQMRIAVTTLDYSLMGVFDGANIFNASSVSINGGQTGNNATYLEVTTTGLTQFRPYVGIFQNNSAAYIGFSAEL